MDRSGSGLLKPRSGYGSAKKPGSVRIRLRNTDCHLMSFTLELLTHEFNDDTLTHEFHDHNPTSWVPWRQSYGTLTHEFHEDNPTSWVKSFMMTLLSQWWHSFLNDDILTSWVSWWHSYLNDDTLISWVPWWHSYLNDDTLTSWVPWWVAGSYVFGECSLSATCWQS